jgi:hypothetical protein
LPPKDPVNDNKNGDDDPMYENVDDLTDEELEQRIREEQERLRKIREEKIERDRKKQEEYLEKKKKEDEIKKMDTWHIILAFLADFKYGVNFWVFALPFFIFGALGVAVNIFLNIEFNHGWAGGNLFLFFNTIMTFWQYFMGDMLIFEIDGWLRTGKFLRMLSFSYAAISSCFYFYFLYDVLDHGLGWNKEEPTFLEVYYTLFVAYNLLMNTPQ